MDKPHRKIFEKNEQKREEEQKKRAEAREEMKKIFAIAFASPEGNRVLTWLCRKSGFLKGATVQDPQSTEINTQATVYNLGAEALYRDLRSLLPPETVFNAEKPLMREDL